MSAQKHKCLREVRRECVVCHQHSSGIKSHERILLHGESRYRGKMEDEQTLRLVGDQWSLVGDQRRFCMGVGRDILWWIVNLL